MKKIEGYIPLTKVEIENSKQKIIKNYNLFLKKEGVKLPRENTASFFQLIYLTYFENSLVSKEAISSFVKENIPIASGDQQVRHLGSQKGWSVFNKGEKVLNEIVPSGYYCLTTLQKAKVSWLLKKEARKEKAFSFNDLKKKYGYCCATCGAKEGENHRFSFQITKLQKGHINPNLPLTEENTIPQCAWCNQNIYKNDFVFTKEGRPQKINNPTYILKSEEEVQRQIYELLKEKFSGEY